MQQDFLLVRKMQNGDEAAMDIFVQKYYPKILQYCGYHCPDREAAYDLTQETFERFFRNLIHYHHKGKALNFLYTIAGNLCIDWMRKNKTAQCGQSMEEDAISGGGGLEGLDDKMIIEAALAKIPDEMREVVILHYFQELSMREIADILQIGVPLVKYRIRMAKEQLKVLIGEEARY